MRDSNSLVEQQQRRLKAPSTASPIAAGQPASSTAADTRAGQSGGDHAHSGDVPTGDHVDAINQIFTELELAYHNQFHKAFPNDRQLALAKQLWLHALADITPARLRAGVRRAIKSATFLPSLHALRAHCEPDPRELGLPDVHAAYVEACRAPSPKAQQAWSHPAVYHAGRATDWHLLASAPESKAYPVFKHNYEQLVERLMAGERLDLPVAKALPEEITQPLSPTERRERLRQLRDEVGL